MLLPQIKEREYRFKLALRMGLPIFALVFALVFHTLLSSKESLSTSFYVESILILFVSINFIFYLIYKGFDTKITDIVSGAFTREYMYECLKKEIKQHKEYTLVLVSISNLYEINSRYGLKNGDKILFETLNWMGEYFKSKNIINFPIGRIKGGDFVIGLRGGRSEYKTVVEFMLLKSDELKVDDIEVQIAVSMNDTALSNNLDFLLENLFELQKQNSKAASQLSDEEINPSELEYQVINAIKRGDLVLFTQDVFEKGSLAFKECSVKLKTIEEKLIHQRNYLKVLDKLRLMGDYDVMVIQKAIELCKKSKSDRYAVTIAATSIRNPLLFIKIKELLNQDETLKGRIILLFSENEYYPKIDRFNALLRQLRETGALIAIDRVGSLHTSFLYLRDLDIDIMRLSPFYTQNIEKKSHHSFVRGFQVMAHEKGVKSWMRMVEDEKSKEVAEELGIDYLQGKYLAPLEKI